MPYRASLEKPVYISMRNYVISTLLLNLSISTNHIPAGAADFLTSLIYVIKANPSLVAFSHQIYPALLIAKAVNACIRMESILFQQKSFIRDLYGIHSPWNKLCLLKHMQCTRCGTGKVVTGVDVAGSSLEIVS